MNHTFKIPEIIGLFLSLTLCFTSCKPNPTLPEVTTTNVTGITQTTATTGGNVTKDGNAEVSSRGVCWNTSENPAISNSKTSDGTGTGLFTSSLTQLIPGTKYYVRAYATNSEGTSYGNEITFTSNPIILATITTASVTSVTSTTVVSGGNITSDGGGAITVRGVCWATTPNPTTSNNKTVDGSGTGTFTSNITGLSENTKYYIRAYCTNSAGTAYGDEKSFTTEPLKDADGNVYSSIKIGTQVWMGENLKTTKYNDGTSIPLVSDAASWAVLNSPGYCWYNNDEGANKATYGALYHWLTGNTGKLCPTGWHVPTDAEWTILTTYLGGEAVSGGKLKKAGTSNWQDPNTGATNESGFTALAGGFRAIDGSFNNIGTNGYWDSATEYNASNRYGREMRYNGSDVIRGPYGKRRGISVRCLKD